MKREIVVYPYKMKSESAILLSEALDVYRVYPDRKYVPEPTDVIINWGNGYVPRWDKAGLVFLNHPTKVMNAINKITSFKMFRKGKVRFPAYTTDKEMAAQWAEEGCWVVCRQELEGRDGSGLVLAKTEEALVPARLYTKFVPGTQEFRAYVWMGKLIDVFDKRRKNIETCDPDIRTESRDWVFCKNPPFVPDDLGVQANLAIKALGLDFGGVDLIYNKEQNKSYVLEVNTAPGIYGTTVTKLRDEILNYAKSLE